jgi:TetR/AcrR family transcriptional regulator, cholesterol catabolism regulator
MDSSSRENDPDISETGAPTGHVDARPRVRGANVDNDAPSKAAAATDLPGGPPRYQGPNRQRMDAILQAAAELFRERGFHGASVQDIAARVGMRKGNLYNYVSSKEELLLLLVQEPAGALLDEVARLRARREAPELVWRRLVELQVRIFADYYPAPFIYLGLTREQRRSRFPTWDTQYFEHLIGILTDGRDDGAYREDLDVEVAARAIMGVTAWMSGWYEPRGPESDERIVREFSAFISHGLQAPDG